MKNDKREESKEEIDITFNVFTDTPKGKDPDYFSPTLRRYHQILWSKKLPNGKYFYLDRDIPKFLHHKSELGEFLLSSDQIANTYTGAKKMSHVIDQVPRDEMEYFSKIRATIAGHAIFPANRIENKITINGARGFNHKIRDRFDLTLECIRRFYNDEDSPLKVVFERYADFFYLFQDFQGYVDFFLYQDLIEGDYSKVRFWHPFDEFKTSSLPTNLAEYLSYKEKVIDFLKKRNDRILNENKHRLKHEYSVGIRSGLNER